MLNTGLAFDYNVSRIYAEKLDTAYPFLKCGVIGRTWGNRGIFSFSLGNKYSSVLLMGGARGNDPESSAALYRFIDEACEKIYTGEEFSGVNISSLLTKFGITVVPCLNPDGIEIFRNGLYGAAGTRCITECIPCENYSEWTANASGTELSLNLYPKVKDGSQSLFASPKGFCGLYPMSEPETRAFISLCKRRMFRSITTVESGENSVFCERPYSERDKGEMMERIISSCGFKPCRDGQQNGFTKWFTNEFEKTSLRISFHEYEKLREALVMSMLM